ncbi:MAG: isoprenylcysteine carboxylmethyltransferase family protein [Anaerolineae bacterium]|jgi:protein-S-isoprenylcysteine O-methyltransferase Ste14|nr:isoprenylcysteine carboxylmethyltransferase family protein [Anaerolineae bacterium]
MMEKQTRQFPIRVFLLAVFFIAILPLFPIFISGEWGWWEVWLYASISVVSFVLSRFIAGRKNPGLLQERAKYTDHEDAQPWDRILSPLVGFGGVFILIVAGLDELLGWTASLSLALRLIGLAILVAGHLLGDYAIIVNAFFSGVVRLQTERGQHVIDSGPYAWVRHPGYAGALLTYLGTPLLLNSWWAFFPVAFMFIIVIYRTFKEDHFLQENLPGYKEFTKKTRFRLFPGLW